MKRFCIIAGLFLIFLYLPRSEALSSEKTYNDRLLSREAILILQEIKNLREDMNKRFEQVDKRFEQVDKRFEFIQLLLIALLGVVITTSIYGVLRDRRLPKELERTIEITRKHEIIIREIIERDPKLLEHFKNIGLL